MADQDDDGPTSGMDGPTDQEIRDLLDAERHRHLVEDRRQRHLRLQRAEEALTFADVLDALAAHRTAVTVRTADRTLPTSQVCEIGRDYVVLRSDGPVTRLVPLDRIASASPAAPTSAAPVPLVPAAPGAHPVPSPLRLDLSERLRELAGVRAHMQVTAAGARLAGRLRRVGADVVVLEQDDGTDRFIALAALDDVVVVS